MDAHSLPLDDQRRGDDVALLGLEQRPTSGDTPSSGPAPDARGGSSEQGIGVVWDRDRGTSANADPVEVPVAELRLLAKKNQSTRKRVSPILAVLFIAVLIGVGAAFAWDRDDAKEIVRSWVPSLSWSSPNSTTSLLPNVDIAAKNAEATSASRLSAQDAVPAPAVIQTVPGPSADTNDSELARRIEAMARTLAVVQENVERLASTQEQAVRDIARLREAEQESRKAPASPLPQTVPMPPRKKTSRAAPLQPAAQLLPEPPPSEQPSVGPTPPEPRTDPIPRPPLPLRDQ